MYPTEICWQMGLYTDECICDFCEQTRNPKEKKAVE